MHNGSAHVLLAEDNPTDARLLLMAFDELKIQPPYHLSDGEEVIKYLAGDEPFSDRSKYPFPDLLLLDLKLPVKDGFEVLEWIQNHDDLPRIPIIVLTASEHLGDIERAYDLGANTYFVKPLEYHGLLAVVKSIYVYWQNTIRGGAPLRRGM